MRNYVTDDCQERGYIAEVPGIHGSIEFEYRPLLPEEQRGIADAAEKMNAKASTKIMADAMERKILSWDMVDERGAELPVTSEIIRRLKPSLFSRMYLVISSMRASDPKPGDEDAADKHKHEVTIDDILSGRSEEESQAKN